MSLMKIIQRSVFGFMKLSRKYEFSKIDYILSKEDNQTVIGVQYDEHGREISRTPIRVFPRDYMTQLRDEQYKI